jgi:hypothetical protein
MPQPSEREIKDFSAVLKLPAAKRVAYLDEVCAGASMLCFKLVKARLNDLIAHSKRELLKITEHFYCSWRV